MGCLWRHPASQTCDGRDWAGRLPWRLSLTKLTFPSGLSDKLDRGARAFGLSKLHHLKQLGLTSMLIEPEALRPRRHSFLPSRLQSDGELNSFV
jgi:hypothetical protein